MKSFYVIGSILVLIQLTQAQSCLPTEWMCDNGKCVSAGYICDGDNDCGDNSDEGGESSICPKCPSGYWKCDNGRCIQGGLTCDNFRHCTDGSDEMEHACPCNGNELRCGKPPGSPYAGACIPLEWFCDEEGIWDCPLGDDEANCGRSAQGLGRK